MPPRRRSELPTGRFREDRSRQDEADGSGKPAAGRPAAFQGAMLAERGNHVIAAGGLEPADRADPGAEEQLIEPHDRDQPCGQQRRDDRPKGHHPVRSGSFLATRFATLTSEVPST